MEIISNEARPIRLRTEQKKKALFPNFRSLLNEDGNLLGVRLASLFNEGNIVAIQRDRVLFGVSPMDVEVNPGLVDALAEGAVVSGKSDKCAMLPVVDYP